MSKLHDELIGMSACTEAIKWVGEKELPEAWETCERADWMLWFAHRRGVDPRVLTRAACACARTALQYVPPAEDRPRLAIAAAEAWADNPTAANREAAQSAAAQSAAAAESARRAAAAWAAAAAAAAESAWSARAAAAAQSAAAWAAWAAAESAQSAAHKKMCNIVRGLIPVKMLDK